MTTAMRNVGKSPSEMMAEATTVAKPAAGPETESSDPEKSDMIMPPTTPAMIPENSGAPEASAMPKQSGNATRKTTSPAGTSCDAYRKLGGVIRRFMVR
jgi:hypothetical protein